MIIYLKNLIKVFFILSIMLLLSNCSYHNETIVNHETLESKEKILEFETLETTKEEIVPLGAKALIDSYIDFNLKYIDNDIVFEDGTRIIYDDGIEKSYLEKLDHCDIEDMYKEKYDINVIDAPYLYDPGRYRCEELFEKMYGASEREVINNLAIVTIFGNEFEVTKVNGVADKLKNLSKEIEKHEEWRPYFAENAGAFNYRAVSKTGRMSAHSYGIAIDLNSQLTNYWRWGNSKLSEVDELININKDNQIPYEITQLFEKNGFIWGGRWYHYDTMHFEYRPDLIYVASN